METSTVNSVEELLSEAGSGNKDLTISIYRPLTATNKDEQYEGKTIKSFAVDMKPLKSSNPFQPPKLLILQNNTNLNTKPANWLAKKSPVVPYNPLGNPRVGIFTSFNMASTFLNCIGEVDVVCEALVIKKLLKIPYSKESVSLMVHRVGNTLLLDEFDIHTHLLRAAENEWTWLKKFYLEHIFASLHSKGNKAQQDRRSSRHSRDYLQQQNLISKFLYHSLALSESDTTVEAQISNQKNNQQVQEISNDPLGAVPSHSQEESPIYDSLPQFSKNIIWTFEDLRMLIGTDLPIFGGGTHPCLSLRLRDMSKPINVLTGLDYWLDNLMCNVPEVVMCYHLGGLVQKYELIKTDDLPRLPGSQFKPNIIKDVAQNILSFLKSKATKAGHTYWLFKGKDDDIVKLYDLSSLCSDMNEDANQNPFTTPVAMLLFKVARNLKLSSDWKRHQGTVLALLKNCLAILDAEKYPQVAIAALYYLSDIYLPTSLKVAESSENSESPDENWEYEWDDEFSTTVDDEFSASVDVQALSTPQQVQSEEVRKNVRPSVGENLEQRCLFSLQHAVDALEHLAEKKEPSNSCKEEPEQASPLKPIPMPYQKLSCEILENKAEESSSSSEKCQTLISKEPLVEWKQQYWRLLVEKCLLAHVTIADEARKGEALRNTESLAHLRMAAVLWNLLDQPSSESRSSASSASLRNYAIGLAGDVYFSMVQSWNDPNSRQESSIQLDPSDHKLINILRNLSFSPTNPEDYFPHPSNLQDALCLSLDNYRLALATLNPTEAGGSESEGLSLAKRLGNVCNEMGVFFMSKATFLLEQGDSDWKRAFVELFQASRQHLESGVGVFRKISDTVNIALLSCNLAKLYRLQARALAPAEKKEASIAEWKCYSKALHYYREAMDELKHRELNAAIWDSVVWDYSSVLFTLATLLQDFAPLSIKSREEVEAEIVQLLETCIALCLGETSPSRLPLLQYRAATSYYRLASLHHDTYRNGEGESIINGKNVRTAAEENYTSAYNLYSQLSDWNEVIRLQLEKAGLYEFQIKRLTGTMSKIRVLQSMLHCFLSTAPAISALVRSSSSSSPEGEGDTTALETKTLDCMTLIGPRIQSTLLQLNKLAKNVKNKQSTDAETYRNMYSVSLKYNGKDTDWQVQLSRTVTELFELQNSLEKC